MTKGMHEGYFFIMLSMKRTVRWTPSTTRDSFLF
jgi:hypothetical protein